MNIFKILERTFAKSREIIREKVNTLSEEDFISEWRNAVDTIWGEDTIKEVKAQMKRKYPDIQFDEAALTKSLYLSYTKLAIVLLEEYIVRDNQDNAN